MSRKAFKFYRSYFDVYNQLSNKDKVAFIDALLNKQFHDQDPNLEGMANFAYTSQKHSIDAQVEGYKSKTKSELVDPMQGGILGGTQGGVVPPSVQEKEKEQVQQGSIDFNKLKDTYNSICTNLPKCKIVSDNRRALIRAVVKEMGKEGLLEVMRKANKSKFLTGSNDRKWRANFDFLLHPKQSIRILEGFYDDSSSNKTNWNLYTQ